MQVWISGVGYIVGGNTDNIFLLRVVYVAAHLKIVVVIGEHFPCVVTNYNVVVTAFGRILGNGFLKTWRIPVFYLKLYFCSLFSNARI